MIKLLVLVIGIILISFILWWFFAPRTEKEAIAQIDSDQQAVTIEVNGGYNPGKVILKKGVPATINFKRKDASSCLDSVVFSDFGIQKDLPLNQIVSVSLDPKQAGEYEFACGMNMFHGKVIVK